MVASRIPRGNFPSIFTFVLFFPLSFMVDNMVQNPKNCLYFPITVHVLYIVSKSQIQLQMDARVQVTKYFWRYINQQIHSYWDAHFQVLSQDLMNTAVFHFLTQQLVPRTSFKMYALELSLNWHPHPHPPLFSVKRSTWGKSSALWCQLEQRTRASC